MELKQPKKNHKIVITDVALNKINAVMTKNMTPDIAEIIKNFHKEVLKTSKESNDNNEVLIIASKYSDKKVVILGTEGGVDPSSSVEARVMCGDSERYEIMYFHNHPCGNGFSVSDIVSFILYQYIGIMTVVTNRGQVYILEKNSQYDFQQSSLAARPIYDEYEKGNMSDSIAAKEMIKILLKEGGVYYARG